MTHLWEFDHPYYCETGRWCEHQGSNRFGSWAEFTETGFYGFDRDQNLLVRWDWNLDEDFRHELLLFFVLQRKPIFATCRIPVTPDDETAIRVWLTECAQTMAATWAPLLEQAAVPELTEAERAATAATVRKLAAPPHPVAAGSEAQSLEPVEACGEVGTSFPYGSHQQPMDTEPCALPYGHEEDHDWAQREAAIRRALYDTLSPNFEIDAEAYNTAAVVISKLVGPAS